MLPLFLLLCGASLFAGSAAEEDPAQVSMESTLRIAGLSLYAALIVLAYLVKFRTAA